MLVAACQPQRRKLLRPAPGRGSTLTYEVHSERCHLGRVPEEMGGSDRQQPTETSSRVNSLGQINHCDLSINFTELI